MTETRWRLGPGELRHAIRVWGPRIVGLLFTVLVGWYYARTKRPAIAFVLMNQAHVLGVDQPLPDARVLVRGQDIDRDDLDLQILTERVENRGAIDILPSQYDQTLRWGFRVEPCQILSAPVIGANSEYLQAIPTPQATGDSVVIEKIIFDHGKYMTLEVEALCPKHREPMIVAFGKVAGIDSFITEHATNASGPKSWLSEAFGGPISVQLARLLAFHLLFRGVRWLVTNARGRLRGSKAAP